MGKENAKNFIIYKGPAGDISVSAYIKDETIWLTQKEMAELFGCSTDNISLHLKKIFDEGELDLAATAEKFSVVQKEGSREVKRTVLFYNLDAIISVGYRVNSARATQFRIWATKILKEYIRKGFALDDERLKEGRSRYFRELLQRVRDIRSSERNLYQQVTDIYATAIDYDPKSPLTKEFFATVQNKMHYAAHKNTAAEVIYNRADNQKPFVGMTNFKGNYVTSEDVKIAKNYLTEKELLTLNLLVSQFLDYAELQALEERTMTMQDWIDELDNVLMSARRELLHGKGTVSHKQAIKKALKEFEIYRAMEMKNLESDFDKAIKAITQKKPE